MLAITYMITLNQAEAQVLALAALLALLAWAWGALLKAGLGLNRWFGLLTLIPIINVIAFIAAGALAHRQLLDKQAEAAYEKTRRLIEEERVNAAVPTEADLAVRGPQSR